MVCIRYVSVGSRPGVDWVMAKAAGPVNLIDLSREERDAY
jgi:hypothetical protein